MIVYCLYSYVFNIKEPLELIGKGEYNLNALTDIRVTDSYLGLDQGVKECQNEESLYDCTTRKYNEAFWSECGCLPVNINLSNQVDTSLAFEKN